MVQSYIESRLVLPEIWIKEGGSNWPSPRKIEKTTLKKPSPIRVKTSLINSSSNTLIWIVHVNILHEVADLRHNYITAVILLLSTRDFRVCFKGYEMAIIRKISPNVLTESSSAGLFKYVYRDTTRY